MSYKPGDKVLVEGVVFEAVDKDGDVLVSFENNNGNTINRYVLAEQIHPATEFKYGEEVEVSDNEIDWVKAIFLADLSGKCVQRHVVVASCCEREFKNGEEFNVVRWYYCRKIQKQNDIKYGYSFKCDKETIDLIKEFIKRNKNDVVKALEDAGVIKDGKVLEG